MTHEFTIKEIEAIIETMKAAEDVITTNEYPAVSITDDLKMAVPKMEIFEKDGEYIVGEIYYSYEKEEIVFVGMGK